MSDRIVYVNGNYLPEREASLSIFDRGLLFADGIYEVSAVCWGQLIDNDRHLDRLARSLAALHLESPLDRAAIVAMQHELIRRNDFDEGVIYLQITRGPAERNFLFPHSPKPSLFAFPQALPLIDLPLARTGAKIKTTADLRWARCDIKTVALLGASLAKTEAVAQGFNDAWLVDQSGRITEGTSSNAWIITAQGHLVTRPLSNDILAGITRAAVIRLATEEGLHIEERAFTVAEAHSAVEAFISSAGHFICPVVEIDSQPIGTGQPGPLVQRLRHLYIEEARRLAHQEGTPP